jgi:transcriptional regulator with XRE-family HTH domain
MPKTLGRVIKELREESGLTKFALAKSAGIDPAVLARLEAGERETPRFPTLCRIAAALGVSLDALAIECGYLPGTKSHLSPAAEAAAREDTIRHLRRLLTQAENLLDDLNASNIRKRRQQR